MNADHILFEDFFRRLQCPEWELTSQVAGVVSESGPFGRRIVEMLMDNSLARVESILKARQAGAPERDSSGKVVPVRFALENVLAARQDIEKNRVGNLHLPTDSKLSQNPLFLPQQLLVMAHAIGPDRQRETALGLLVHAAASFHLAFDALAEDAGDFREILRTQAEYARGAMARAARLRDEIPSRENRLQPILPDSRDSHAWALKLSML